MCQHTHLFQMLEATEKIRVENQMWQHTHMFQRLEATKNIRAYTVQNVVGGNCITEEDRAKKWGTLDGDSKTWVGEWLSKLC